MAKPKAPRPKPVELEFHLPLRTEHELREFTRRVWGVEIPNRHVCQAHATPWEAYAAAYFGRSPMIIWEGSRGFAGKSYLLAVLGLTMALTLGANVNLLGGSGEQAKRIMEYQDQLWHRAKRRGLVEGEWLQGPRLKTLTRFRGGHKLTALMASSASVRGPHVQRLLIDEADEVSLELLDAALGQPMEAVGAFGDVVPECTVMSSTHHYPDGTMTELKRRARAAGWGYFAWCYKETLQPHGWLKPAAVDRKKRNTTEAMFRAEYDLQEPSPETRAFAPSAVAVMFSRDAGVWADDAEWVARVADPFPGVPSEPQEAAKLGPWKEPPGQYAIGADWARKKDWTCFVVLRVDYNPYQVVHFERMQREPWPMMAGRLDALAAEYGATVAHDATGLGDVLDQYLSCGAVGVILSGRTRDQLFAEYINAVERHLVAAPFIDYLEREHRTCSVDDLMTGGGHPPDSVVASALAYHAAQWAQPVTFS